MGQAYRAGLSLGSVISTAVGHHQTMAILLAHGGCSSLLLSFRLPSAISAELPDPRQGSTWKFLEKLQVWGRA